MPVTQRRPMSASIVGPDNIVSLAASFTNDAASDEREFKVKFPDGEAILKVRIFGIIKRHRSEWPYLVIGEVVEADGREWESLDAYFQLTASTELTGMCRIGSFPELDIGT